MVAPILRVGVDWDDDLFICYDALQTDVLNRMHTGLTSDPGFTNLHWNYINTSAINSAVLSFVQGVTDYGIRQFHVVTGTNTTAGAYFGRTGTTNDFAVTNATTYTAVFWIKATVGSGTSFLFSMENSTGNTTFSVTTSWQKVTRTFTTTGTTTAFKIVKNTSATDVTFDMTGFMIVAGSTAPNGFNVGHATNLYDTLADLTRRDVRSVNWQVGRRDWKNLMIEEGIANLTLDNSTKRYSPEYASSPLYGYLGGRVLTTIEIQDPITLAWKRKFTGWTRQIKPEPGGTSRREATLTCEQGKFQLERIKYTKLPSTATGTADTIIKDIINNGFISGATPLQVIMSKTKLGAGYFRAEADIMSIEAGVSTLSLTGEDWGAGQKATQALQEILKVDQGFFFIDGNGKVIYYNRLHYVDPATTPTAITINLDSETIGQAYGYGNPYYNHAQITYYLKRTTTETVWESPSEGIVVRGRRTRTVDVNFEHTEGSKKTIQSINSFTASVNPSTIQLMNYVATQQGNVTGEILEVENGRAKLLLRNSAPMNLRVGVTLRGVTIDSSGGQVVTVLKSGGAIGGQVTVSERSKLLTSESEARNLGVDLLNRFRSGIGEFTNIRFLPRDNTWLQHALNAEQGAKLALSETQTGHTGNYVVIGEQHDWRPGMLNSTISLYNLNRQTKYWIIGTSALNTDAYLGY